MISYLSTKIRERTDCLKTARPTKVCNWAKHWVSALISSLLVACVSSPALTDTSSSQSPRESNESNGHRVVLVHGIFDDGRRLAPIAKVLEEKGYTCFSPHLKPTNAYFGIRDLALKLEAEINAYWGDDTEFTVVGFSMGGLVSRYFLQELGGAKRCMAFATISSPHHGTLLGYTFPTRGVGEMKPGSNLLAKLNSEESLKGLAGVPIYSYYTPFDLMIIPAASSVWASARNRKIWMPLHQLVPSDQRLHEQLLADLSTALNGKIVANNFPQH